jgi:hypothetical protein
VPESGKRTSDRYLRIPEMGVNLGGFSLRTLRLFFACFGA